ncbi:MAG TPA: CHAT domain-containing protein, partial [Lacipirellulaceae bacterium]|nr:CHAT domain-containing protein [Lacipirellulaceae bacterium]
TSSVVSLTLRQAAAKLPWQANRRTLNAHWQDVNCHEKATDLLDYMRETRQIQAEALKKWELWSLGAPDELPRATVEHLIAALAGKTFDVVLVNAHGDRHDGVLLANNVLWRGDGANFQGTDLLVLACCSVGDLRQRTATDVEGFYATLAAHRCRTVVAPRWPINAITTKLFTEKLLSKYANKRQAAGDGGLPDFAKARCLAEARRELLLNSEVSRAKRRIQAITLSAFELYGVA